jgi:hypothetical protein
MGGLLIRSQKKSQTLGCHFFLVCRTSLPLSPTHQMASLENHTMPQSNSSSSSTDYDVIQQQLMAIRTEVSTTNPLLASILARPPGNAWTKRTRCTSLSTALVRSYPDALDAAVVLASRLDSTSLTSMSAHS